MQKTKSNMFCGTPCNSVAKDCLNESRDPDRGLGSDRYTSRYFLKHTVLEQVAKHSDSWSIVIVSKWKILGSRQKMNCRAKSKLLECLTFNHCHQNSIRIQKRQRN